MMNEMTSTERDDRSRERIVSEIDANFFVEAGAGSGKTTMLVSRMTAMVEAGIPIDRICAITFTKAAAGEFYDRFRKMLIERSNPNLIREDTDRAGQLPEPTDRTRELCAAALEHIDLCFMGTIDSFCSMVLSEHPSEARIPSDAAIVSDDVAEALFRQQYVKICSGEYGPELAGMADTFRSFYRDPGEVFVLGESVLMNERNVRFLYPEPAVTDIDRAYAAEREDLIKALRCLTDHPELAYTDNKDSVAAWDKIGEISKDLGRKWSNSLSDVLYAIESLKNLRILPEATEHYEYELGGLFEPGGARGKWLECTLCREDGLLSKLQGLRYSVSMAFLEACVPVLEGAMREKGYLTFFDCLYDLREMLRRDAEGDGRLIRYISDRHRYFLIDEFQDTNPMQAEIFFYLSAEQPVPRWSDCVPRPGSLFIVGDPKQSIYRFRGADVSSFLRVKGLFEKNGGAVLSLPRNFRSTSVLCTYFNRVFSMLLPEETAEQSRFEEIPVPEPRQDEFQGVFTYQAYTGKLEAEHPDETDPVRIASIIDRIVDNDAYLIRTEPNGAPRKLRYSDIMVITRGKKKLRPIMELLDEKGIPARVEGEVPFGTNAALTEIFRIYAAVADPEDAVSLYGALTGKLIGLSKEDLLTYRKNDGKLSLKAVFDSDACDDETVARVAAKIAELRELHYRARRLSPAALFAAIMEEYRVYETVPAENLEVLYYALELLRGAEKAGPVVSHKDGAAYLAGLLCGESGEERCLSLDDGRDAVHMANLHKVKGLEAPVIILSASVPYTPACTKRVVHRDDGSEGYLFALSARSSEGWNRKYFSTGEFADEQEEEKAAGAAEEQRLIYVAATRARNVLILCDSIAAAGRSEAHKSSWKPLMETGLRDFFDAAGACVPHSRPQAETADPAALYAEAEKTCVFNDRTVEARTYRVENPSRLHLASKIAEEQEVVPLTPETAGAGQPEKGDDPHRFPALLGTMTHKLMEMLVSTRDQLDVTSAVGEILREYRTAVTEPYEAKLAAELSGVARQMRAGGYVQTNGLPQDMLRTLLQADEVYCEVPFCYTEDGEDGRILWNGIMDVIYHAEGRWHIVDYKTNADGSDLDKKYQAQLDAYIRAFRATTGEEADARTYHIDI